MKTKNITVNNVGDPEAVTADTVCRKVTVGEDPSVAGFPTTDFKVRKPGIADTPRQLQAGDSYTFERPAGLYWQPGDVCGYVEAVTGSTTFFQDESE